MRLLPLRCLRFPRAASLFSKARCLYEQDFPFSSMSNFASESAAGRQAGARGAGGQAAFYETAALKSRIASSALDAAAESQP